MPSACPSHHTLSILMLSEQLSCVFHKIMQVVSKYNWWLLSDVMTSLSYCYELHNAFSQTVT